jgi:hypothetical protein
MTQPLASGNSSPGKTSSDRTLAAQAVFWCGVAFVGLFLINTAATALPPALLQPAWQLNVALSLQSNGLQALIGTAMLATAPLLNPDNLRLNIRAELIRRIAAWICVGWLLLIPLLMYRGAQLLRESRSNAELQLRQFDQQIALLQQTRDEQSFRAQFAALSPSSPPFPVQLPASLDRVRAEAVQQFKAQLSLQQTKLYNDFRASSESFVLQTLRISLLSVLLTLGFAAIGRWQTDGPSVLSKILQWSDAKSPRSVPQRIQNSWKSYKSLIWRWRAHWSQWYKSYQLRRSSTRKKAAARKYWRKNSR